MGRAAAQRIGFAAFLAALVAVWPAGVRASDVETSSTATIAVSLPPPLPIAEPREEAPSMTFGLVNTLTAEARLDNGNAIEGDDGFGVFVDRLNLSGTTDRVAINVRVDGVAYVHTPTTAYQKDLRLERVTAELHLGHATLVAGDFYRQIGRGILLAMRKVDEVGLDVGLRGAEARWAPEGHQLAAFAGVANTANIDAASVLPVKDTGDLLAGATYELSAIEGLTLGAHGLYLQPSERLLDTLDYTISGGASAELPELFAGFSFYTEVDAQSRRLAGANELGTAIYFTTDWSAGDLSLLFEALRLDDFQERGSRNTALKSPFDYNIPPTLERIDQEVAQSINVEGARLRAELALLGNDLITHANGMVRVNDAGKPNELLQLHGYGGAEYRFDERTSKASLSGGYRNERTAGAELKSMVHFEAEMEKALGKGWALHLTSNNEFRKLYDNRYARGSSFAGAEWASHGSLTFELGYDTQDPRSRNVFFAGILQLDFSDAVRLRTTAGTERGGLKCVAGVCREFPPFAGVRSELVIRL